MQLVRSSFLLIVFIFISQNLFAQNEPPQELVWVCNYNGGVYYDWLNTSTDVGGTWPAPGAVRYYNFDPSGRRALNYASNTAYNCYGFIAGSPANESCRVSGNNGVRGYFLYSTTYCPLDDYIPLLLIIGGILGFATTKRRYLYVEN